MIELLWLLLPVAAASGWYAASRNRGEAARSLNADYFRGINYLLNEQPDKAIEAFIRILEIDSETVETHLALGNLYRRRGEVDRAIRLHQNLIARTNLDEEQRVEALFELGQDYFSAGLLDRAEDIFRELVQHEGFRERALRQVILVYEQEGDWKRAEEAARDLEQVTGSKSRDIAHYLCEQAELRRGAGDAPAALSLCSQALVVDPECVRVSLIEGDVLFDMGKYDDALTCYRRVSAQDPDYVPETVARLEACYEGKADLAGLASELDRLRHDYPGMTVTLAAVRLAELKEGAAAAARLLADVLRHRPNLRGATELLALEHRSAVLPKNELIENVMGELGRDRPSYRCQSCGFPAKLLHWQCPGCKRWNTVRRIQGVEGE